MSVITTCDYCGETIDPDELSVEVTTMGHFPNEDGHRRFHNFAMGNYHTEPRDSGKACYWRIKDSIDLTEELGAALEAIPTISAQAVAARRRKHHKIEEN